MPLDGGGHNHLRDLPDNDLLVTPDNRQLAATCPSRNSPEPAGAAQTPAGADTPSPRRASEGPSTPHPRSLRR